MKNDKLLIYCDGGSRGNPGRSASAFVVVESGKVIHSDAILLGIATNNVAEYKAVILALDWLKKSNDYRNYDIEFILDSELVAKQLAGKFKIKNEKLRNLFYTANNLIKEIPTTIFFNSVEREKNKLADFLVNKILDEKG